MRRESPPVQPSLKDQLHFVVEVVDRVALSRGMQGLMLHVARALNWHWGRKGLIEGKWSVRSDAMDKAVDHLHAEMAAEGAGHAPAAA